MTLSSILLLKLMRPLLLIFLERMWRRIIIDITENTFCCLLRYVSLLSINSLKKTVVQGCKQTHGKMGVKINAKCFNSIPFKNLY